MNYVKILLEDGLKEVRQQKLELIALTGNEAPSEIRKVKLIEMQLEQALKFNKRNFLKTDIKTLKKLKTKGYSFEEIATIFNIAESTVARLDYEYRYIDSNLKRINIEY